MVDKIQIDAAVLKKFQPFEQLSERELKQLRSSIKKNALPPGKLLFKEAESDHQAIFLLSGEIELLSGRSVVEVIKADTKEARIPLANVQPRKYSARAKTSITLFWLDGSIVQKLSSQPHKVDYDVSEIESDESDDWMVSLLQRPIFEEIPAENIQKLMTRFEPVSVSKGEQVIRQGDEGDYYYFIQTGKCSVLRLDEKTNKEIKLAELKSGDVFGEESLVSGSKRSTSVHMLTDGTLLRLSKANFIDLITNPMLSLVTYQAAEALVQEGARWLDVRAPEQHQKNGLSGSVNIPHYMLRHQINRLETSMHYIAYCDNGQQSASSAFLAQERGYTLSVLKGGLDVNVSKAPADKQTSPTPVSNPAPSPAPNAGQTNAVQKQATLIARAAAEKAVRDKLAMQNQLEILKSKQGEVEQEYLNKITGLEQEMVDTRKDHEHEFYAWQKERDLFKSQMDSLRQKLESAKGSEAQAAALAAKAQQDLHTQQADAEQRVDSLGQQIVDLEGKVSQASDSAQAAKQDQTSHLLKQEIERLEARLLELGDIQTDEQLLAQVTELEQREVVLKNQHQHQETALTELEAKHQAVQTKLQEKSDGLSQQVQTLRDQMEQQVDAQNKAQTQASEVQSAVEAQIQTKKIENTELKKGLDAQQADISLLKQAEQAQTSTLKTLEEKKSSLESELQQALSDANEHQSQVERLERENAVVNKGQAEILVNVERALKISEEKLTGVESHANSLTTQIAALEQTSAASANEISQLQSVAQEFEEEKTKGKKTTEKLLDVQSKLMQLAKVKQQIQTDNDALEGQIHEREGLEKQVASENARLLSALQQEKNALNEKLSTAAEHLKQAQATAVEQAAVADNEQMRTTLAGMVPAEMVALQKELALVRARSSDELKAIIEQRNQWEEKCTLEHQRAESYKEEFQKVDHSKENVFEQNQQLDHTMQKMREECKKLKIAYDEVGAELMLEREETGRLSQELSVVQTSVLEITDQKKHVEAKNFETQHKVVELENRLDGQSRGIALDSSRHGREKKQNSKTFMFFVGMMIGFLFVVFVQFLAGDHVLYSRMSQTFSELMNTPETPKKQPVAPNVL